MRKPPQRRCRKILIVLLVFCLSAGIAADSAEQRAGHAPAPLRIGLFPRMPPERMLKLFQPLADWLAERLGRPVALESAPDLHAFWQRMEEGRYDLVHYNQYHYIKAHQQLGHRVILKNEELGRDTIRAVIWVPADSPITSVGQLRGRKILFGGGREAMVAYIMATDLLHRHGLMPGDYLEASTLTPVEAAHLLYHGQGDAASGGDMLLRLDDMPWQGTGKPPRAIAISEPLAQLPWAVTPEVSPAEERQIQATLLALNDSPKGHHILSLAKLTGLRPARDSEYDPARRIVARVLGEHY